MGVSATRGGGLPSLRGKCKPLTANAPKFTQVVELTVFPTKPVGARGHYNGIFH